MNNYTNVEEFDQPFGGLMENRPSKVLALIFACCTNPLNVLLLYGIVWYEKYGTDNKRTLMNKLVASQCWNLIGLYVISQPVEILSFLMGRLPSQGCFINVVVKNSFKTCMLLLLDSTILVQYLLIFWLKNPAAIHDYFWSFFITSWTAGLSLTFNFAKFYIAHRQPLNYHVCSGILPTGDWSLPSHFGAHFEVLTLLTIIIVKLKIHFFKRKSIEQQMTNRSIFKKNFALEAINKNSLTSFTISLTALLLFSTFVILGLKLNKLMPLEMNKHPNYDWYYVLQLVLPNVVGLIVACLLYFNNPSLRISVLAEWKSYMSVRD